MSRNGEAAAAMFLEGYNCAQSVLVCCGREYGLPRDTAIRVAQAFGGGIGRTGNVCGAATGALMVIGLKCSAKDAADLPAKAEAGRIAQEFLARFKARSGSLLCRDIIGCDLSHAGGLQVRRRKRPAPDPLPEGHPRRGRDHRRAVEPNAEELGNWEIG